MQDTVQDFLKFIEAEKSYAENTIAAYRNDLTQFVSYIEKEVSGDWQAVNKDTIDKFIDYLKHQQEKPYSSSTIARKVAAVKSFARFLIARGVFVDDPTATLDSPKVKKRLPKAISIDAINKLLEVTSTGDSPKSQRDSAIIELLYASGMRVTELVSLDVGDVDFENETVRVIGKSDRIKERLIPISSDSMTALKGYVEKGRTQLLRAQDDPALFLNHRGQRLTRQGSWLIIKRYVAEIGITDNVTPHTLRHSFAAHKLSHGQSLQDIQKLLGHANISTTQVYTHLAKEPEIER
ncbi:MAG: site-specific tyrosine recombinase/integron integrase [Chloroflexota bacterium]